MKTLELKASDLEKLESNPDSPIELKIQDYSASAQIVIPNYLQHLKEFYNQPYISDINKTVRNSGIPFNFDKHFGLEINFTQATELQFHDADFAFLGDCKKLIQMYGVVILRNVRVDQASRDVGHRNRFPHLIFHRDRNEYQPTPYSLYTRDPTDPEQRLPRISSTLFTANIVAYLQCMRENDYEQISGKELNSHYDIFKHEDLSKAIGKVLVEHKWDEPEGTGEIAMLDNRTALHASYLRHHPKPGYRIGVRYLS